MNGFMTTIGLFVIALSLLLGGVWLSISLAAWAMDNSGYLSLASVVTICLGAIALFYVFIVVGATIAGVAFKRVK
jgi:uncharacterized paraquat-inducible protein A